MEYIPDKKEVTLLKETTNIFLTRLNKRLRNAKAIVGGSYAKGTFLPGNKDIDVFVRFKNEKEISNILHIVLKKSFNKIKRVHGSRDYFHVMFNGLLFEVVPVLEIKKPEQALNITDISPLHISYVNKKTNKDTKNEIRKLKLFLKANKLYGAESYIRGFSGYVTELLIIKYKTFDNFIKNVKKWKPKVIIDTEKYYKNKNEALFNLNEAKKLSPLIVIDPVQKERNAAAVLSLAQFSKLKEAVKNPSFQKEIFELNSYKDYILLEVTPKAGKKDIVGSKLLKTFDFIKNKLKQNDFEIIDAGWNWEKKAIFYFKVKNNLPKTKKHYGPLKTHKEHLVKFKKKYKNVKFEKRRSYTMVKRKYTKAKPFIKSLLKEDNVKNKVKKIILK
ncbi:MAG: nucleotidyltransferase domain-containing protein [Nanoarchaeota archaeon]